MEQETTQPHRLYPGTDVHPRDLPPGLEVNGFRLVRHVATGGWGCVWQVESVQRPGHPYALKFSLYPPGAPAQADARAAREVQLLMQAACPNVVRVVGHGRWKDPEGGLRYLVLAWVEGATLLEWVRRTNPSLREVVRLGQKLVRAVQSAHEVGVMHRDIKPDNVLVREEDGEPFLSDFGAAAAEFTSPLTQAGLPPGTPAFLSPEALAFAQHAGGAPYRFRSTDDWYAMGVLLYQVLTEVLPFPDMLAGEPLAHWVARRRPVPVHALNPQVPRALSRVVMRLLSKEPVFRYRHGHALCAALERALKQPGAWEVPVYESRPPGSMHDATTQAPTTGDGLVAQDPQVQETHLFKAANGHEERRLEAARRRRDALLVAQPQVWSPAARRAVAAVLLLGAMTTGGWLAEPWLAGRLRSKPTVTVLQPSPPPEQGAPLLWLPAYAFPPPAGSVAASVPSPTLADTAAAAREEDSPVTTTQRQRPAPPASIAIGQPSSKTARLGALCTAAGMVTACSSVPVRPEPAECPQAAIESMVRLGLDPGDVAGTQLDASGPRPLGVDPGLHTFRPGPIVGVVFSPRSSHLPKGTLLFGRVLAGGGDRFFIRYRELQLPGAARVPICAIVRHEGGLGIGKGPGSTNEVFTAINGGDARFVFQFSE
ncbi:serine/threonine protein kinase [Hyalangium rubrum]|uniref:Protein kinase n=1 Tax=Hyalangium rubrum TaxID=3103134 RepID=A0ABU5H1V4_9BACT|nr:protein kinase [Hyalangium sp. s54d21]MDY7226753.1 protein kinase [Hyalangium sp. s54d21]